VIPSEDEVLHYFSRLSNRGRWGEADERGTLNYIDSTKILEAVREVVSGVSVGCARPIIREPPASDVAIPPLRLSIATHDTDPVRAGSLAPVVGTASDYLSIAPHGTTVTHVDMLSHVSWQGLLYDGTPASAVSALGGSSRLSVGGQRDGIVTRGVLLDVARTQGRPYLDAGEAIMPDHLEAAEGSHGVRVGRGDALLVRTGWYPRRIEHGPHPERLHRPGLHAATLPWLHERQVAVLAADAAVDVVPSGYDSLEQPVHAIGTVAMGLCLIDACGLERLGDTCATYGRWSFMFTFAPLYWPGVTGSPVTPVAIF
jgi:kynurenine formamidase